MKKIFQVIFFCIFNVLYLASQDAGAPYGFNYQAVARDFSGKELTNREILVKINIRSGSETGTSEWCEQHSVTTNKFGLFNITIGKGTKIASESNKASLSDIQWGAENHFLEVSIDFKDEHGYITTGAFQIYSVPYALYANYAANGGSGGPDGDSDPTNERQNLSQVNDTLLQLINNDASIQSSIKNDFDVKNEIQDLMLNNNILKITNNSDANDINLTPYLDNTDDQILINKGDSISISKGNTISLERFYDNTDQQNLYNKDDSIGIVNGNKISLERFKDNTDNQRLILEEDSLRIAGGNAVNISELKNPESIYFYAEKTTISSVSLGSDNYLVFNEKKINTVETYNSTTGTFTVPVNGLYSFYITYEARSSQGLKVYVNNGEYDLLNTASSDGKIRTSFMLYLIQSDVVNIIVNSGGNSQIGKATWAGFKVY